MGIIESCFRNILTSSADNNITQAMVTHDVTETQHGGPPLTVIHLHTILYIQLTVKFLLALFQSSTINSAPWKRPLLTTEKETTNHNYRVDDNEIELKVISQQCSMKHLQICPSRTAQAK